MSITLRRAVSTEDEAAVLALDRALFPQDEPVTIAHALWIAEDARGLPVGFCAAKNTQSYAFLLRAAVTEGANGKGLQRRMIRVREQWAKRQGAKRIITYVSHANARSLVNLIRCGYRFYLPPTPYAGKRFHYLEKDLT